MKNLLRAVGGKMIKHNFPRKSMVGVIIRMASSVAWPKKFEIIGNDIGALHNGKRKLANIIV